MSITKIFDYFKRREEQLEKERLIDEKVAQLPCSSVVTQLLLSDRKFKTHQVIGIIVHVVAVEFDHGSPLGTLVEVGNHLPDLGIADTKTWLVLVPVGHELHGRVIAECHAPWGTGRRRYGWRGGRAGTGLVPARGQPRIWRP